MGIKLKLFSVDFEEDTITLKVPKNVMEMGFYPGFVEVDLSDVQEGKFEGGKIGD